MGELTHSSRKTKTQIDIIKKWSITSLPPISLHAFGVPAKKTFPYLVIPPRGPDLGPDLGSRLLAPQPKAAYLWVRDLSHIHVGSQQVDQEAIPQLIMSLRSRIFLGSEIISKHQV